MAYAQSGKQLAMNKAAMRGNEIVPNVLKNETTGLPIKLPAAKVAKNPVTSVMDAVGQPIQRFGRNVRKVVDLTGAVGAAAVRNMTGADVRKILGK